MCIRDSYMAKTELFENKLIGGFLKSLGAFPISRGTGGAQGIQTAIDLLEEEKLSLIHILYGMRMWLAEMCAGRT